MKNKMHELKVLMGRIKILNLFSKEELIEQLIEKEDMFDELLRLFSSKT